MMNMGQLHKVQAQLHIIIGPQHISIPFESDATAEREFKQTLAMLHEKDRHYRIINHGQGSVWIDLSAVSAMTWTREQRVATPMPGLAGPMPMHG